MSNCEGKNYAENFMFEFLSYHLEVRKSDRHFSKLTECLTRQKPGIIPKRANLTQWCKLNPRAADEIY